MTNSEFIVKPTEGLEEAPITYKRMLYQACQDEGVKLRFLSRNWVKHLEKNGQVHFITGYKFDLNPHALGEIIDDKYALFSVLKDAEVPIIEHAIVYRPDTNRSFAQGCNTIDYVRNYWLAHGGDIVIKPNNGTGGRRIVRVRAEEELALALMKALGQSYSGSMCPFYKIRHEYRAVTLDNEVRLSYMKTLPDEISWKFNLQQGSKSEDIPAEKLPKVTTLAKQTSEAIGLRFGSVDIIETEAGDFMVMEVNSGVMVSKFLKQHPDRYPEIRAMFRDAIRKMFQS